MHCTEDVEARGHSQSLVTEPVSRSTMPENVGCEGWAVYSVNNTLYMYIYIEANTYMTSLIYFQCNITFIIISDWHAVTLIQKSQSCWFRFIYNNGCSEYKILYVKNIWHLSFRTNQNPNQNQNQTVTISDDRFIYLLAVIIYSSAPVRTFQKQKQNIYMENKDSDTEINTPICRNFQW